jgi:putative redox protein
MVTTRNGPGNYLTYADNGRVEIQLDAAVTKGGAGDGFGPHELLEASIAACINMAVRMHAVAHHMALNDVHTSVRIVRPDDGTIRFDQSLHLTGDLSDEDRAALIEAANNCPVRQTLSRRLDFAAIDSLS